MCLDKFERVSFLLDWMAGGITKPALLLLDNLIEYPVMVHMAPQVAN